MEFVLIALLFLLVVFLIMAVRVVKQGYVYTIERLGKFTIAAQPGSKVPDTRYANGACSTS